jgi:hypothetical protein
LSTDPDVLGLLAVASTDGSARTEQRVKALAPELNWAAAAEDAG